MYKGHRLRVNDHIRIPQVLLIDENGKSLGIKTNWEAKKIAQERGFDLVEVVPNARPPVCKLLDYGKYQYEQEKARKKQKALDTKEIRLSVGIEAHDWQTKLRKTKEFLDKGHKVKVILRLTGREMGLINQAIKRVNNFKDDAGAQFEETPKRMGRQIFATLKKVKPS